MNTLKGKQFEDTRMMIAQIARIYAGSIVLDSNGNFSIHNVKEDDANRMVSLLRSDNRIAEVHTHPSGYDFGHFNSLGVPKQKYTVQGRVAMNESLVNEKLKKNKDGSFSNVGKDGSHGKTTKEKALKQLGAMAASGFFEDMELDESEYSSLSGKAATKKDLGNHKSFAKKRQKGLPALSTLNPGKKTKDGAYETVGHGDPKFNAAEFNHAMGSGPKPARPSGASVIGGKEFSSGDTGASAGEGGGSFGGGESLNIIDRLEQLDKQALRENADFYDLKGNYAALRNPEECDKELATLLSNFAPQSDIFDFLIMKSDNSDFDACCDIPCCADSEDDISTSDDCPSEFSLNNCNDNCINYNDKANYEFPMDDDNISDFSSDFVPEQIINPVIPSTLSVDEEFEDETKYEYPSEEDLKAEFSDTENMGEFFKKLWIDKFLEINNLEDDPDDRIAIETDLGDLIKSDYEKYVPEDIEEIIQDGIIEVEEAEEDESEVEESLITESLDNNKLILSEELFDEGLQVSDEDKLDMLSSDDLQLKNKNQDLDDDKLLRMKSSGKNSKSKSVRFAENIYDRGYILLNAYRLSNKGTKTNQIYFADDFNGHGKLANPASGAEGRPIAMFAKNFSTIKSSSGKQNSVSSVSPEKEVYEVGPDAGAPVNLFDFETSSDPDFLKKLYHPAGGPFAGALKITPNKVFITDELKPYIEEYNDLEENLWTTRGARLYYYLINGKTKVDSSTEAGQRINNAESNAEKTAGRTQDTYSVVPDYNAPIPYDWELDITGEPFQDVSSNGNGYMVDWEVWYEPTTGKRRPATPAEISAFNAKLPAFSAASPSSTSNPTTQSSNSNQQSQNENPLEKVIPDEFNVDADEFNVDDGEAEEIEKTPIRVWKWRKSDNSSSDKPAVAAKSKKSVMELPDDDEESTTVEPVVKSASTKELPSVAAKSKKSIMELPDDDDDEEIDEDFDPASFISQLKSIQEVNQPLVDTLHKHNMTDSERRELIDRYKSCFNCPSDNDLCDSGYYFSPDQVLEFCVKVPYYSYEQAYQVIQEFINSINSSRRN